MHLEIDIGKPEPLYQQIVDQIMAGVVAEHLKARDYLPSIRQLADDLEVNPNTVAKAYQCLERANVVVAAGRRGTMIAPGAVEGIRSSQRMGLKARLRAVLQEMRDAQMAAAEIRSIVTDVLGPTTNRRRL